MVMVCLYTEWHELLYTSQSITSCFPAFPFDLPLQILYTVQHSVHSYIVCLSDLLGGVVMYWLPINEIHTLVVNN